MLRILVHHFPPIALELRRLAVKTGKKTGKRGYHLTEIASVQARWSGQGKGTDNRIEAGSIIG